MKNKTKRRVLYICATCAEAVVGRKMPLSQQEHEGSWFEFKSRFAERVKCCSSSSSVQQSVRPGSELRFPLSAELGCLRDSIFLLTLPFPPGSPRLHRSKEAVLLITSNARGSSSVCLTVILHHPVRRHSKRDRSSL